MTTTFHARAAGLRALVLLAALGLGCGDPRPTEPDALPAFAKGSANTTGPTVTATNPSFGDEGTVNLDVQVIGSGFDQGSKAVWDSGGAPYPRITVNSTKFVSSTQLVANISIATNATIQYYDVAVITSTGRKGVGTELFAVTFARPIPGATSAVAVNDAGRVTGLDASGIYVFDVPTLTLQDIGFTGAPYAIDQLGTTVAGQIPPVKKNNLGTPGIWTFAAGAWSQHQIPDLGLGGAVRSLASDNSGAAVILGGNVQRPCGGGSCHTPATWTKDVSGQWSLHTLSLPTDSAHGWIQHINASGLAVGMSGVTTGRAYFWDAGGNFTVLTPLVPAAATAAYSINDAGTSIVGNSNGVAVIWTRPDTLSAWSAPTSLGGCVPADGINASGVIVGCGPAAWRPSGSGYTLEPLGDLGNHHPGPEAAVAVNNGTVAPLIAVGNVGQGVFWMGF